MFFESWQGLLRTLVVGVLAYAALVLLLRISGKRTLSKMNSFDIVVTVSLGSTLATTLLSKDVALAEGLLAMALLIALQFAIAWLTVHSRQAAAFIKAEPRLLVHNSEFLHDAMRQERVTEDEILAAIRESGYSSMNEVCTVVLETNATLTVQSAPRADPSALASTSTFRERESPTFHTETGWAAWPRPSGEPPVARGSGPQH